MFPNLLRSLPVCAIAVALATGGCSKNEKGGADEASGSAAPGDGAAAQPGAWKNVDRVPFSQLQQVFPPTVGGQPRTELGGSAQAAENPWTEALATYGSDTKHITAKIEDNPTYVADVASGRTGSLKGHAIIDESESEGSSVLQLIVAGRFLVHLQGTGFRIAELKQWAEQLDLAKLESWKDHGKKK